MALVQPITNVQPPSPSVENNVGSSYMNPYNVDSFMNKLGNAPMDYAGLVEYNTRANLLASQYAYDANMASMAYQADINSDLMRQQYLLNQQSADTAYQRDSLEAQKKRDWDEMMSNTSYQRAVNDIKQSGLNPILAYTQGGASSPSGATASAYSASAGSASVSRANMDTPHPDTETTRELVKTFINAGASVISSYTKAFGSLFGSLSKFFAG